MSKNNPTSTEVFVTVGSTSFNDLIEAILQCDVLNNLSSAGYRSLRIQFGSGERVFAQRETASKDIQISGFSYSSSLDEEMKNADLVISHAGSGSILEALRLGKKLIVVANQNLMDNHQMELADRLSENHYLLKATPKLHSLGFDQKN
ncbi:UDP-N-acetylglucosamine transferase subunit alg13 [Neolecta irregularis DAH-3]|uniref:UDP-N-acetylglucosamine transferase subunit ALG13 n=1 Tax=Neolecta irregularis (strain DAH-3) TaxID=1198029 RepID=A0A1U7LQA6_NEOID|nr:UDP-N-acetylglucosamine transferase subunit alg13 [Neolecta irregularis DAH-3]|eukprot:OLL24845.1 UDP-N-acetylglucosamine transferase subunit alg13 [Neolecta irregularis DAH-3]